MGLGEAVCVFLALFTHVADPQEPLKMQSLPPSGP